MKYRVPACAFLLAVACSMQAGAPIIRSVDMFSKVGEYYRAYANAYDPLDSTSVFPVPSNTIKPPGENLLWNFAAGPTTTVFRFDYLDPAGVTEAVEFPLAKVAEKKTVEQSGEVSWLFFEQVPGQGRKVYGFYDMAFAAETPAGVFEPAIVDFPETIRFGDTWSTAMTFYSTISYTDPLDPEGSASFPMKLDYHSTFTADAWGTMLLPGLGLVDVLRVNEQQDVGFSIDLAIDPAEAGTYTFIETDYMRNYYWLSPGHGIVAQMNSTQGSAPPENEFTTASTFVRMFETNKQSDPVDPSLQPVDQIEVVVSNGKVFIQWSEAANATRYRLEYSTGGFGPGAWQPLSGDITERQFLDPAGLTGKARFYRVVSLP